MANPKADFSYLQVQSGVQTSVDQTSLLTQHFTFSDKVRFRNGQPEKIGGWTQQVFNSGQAILGIPRSVWSAEVNGQVYTLIGTEKRLYALIGSTLTNITPLQSSSTAASNSLSTHFATLASNPVTTTIGSNSVKVFDSEASKFRVGDTVTLSGATATGGITNTQLNASHFIRSIGSGFYTFTVSSNATSSATGGGASVVRSSGLITLTKSNTLIEGDRVGISGATTTGGVTGTVINIEQIIRNVTATTFDFMTTGLATSSVSSSGGTGTVFFPPIPNGIANESFGQGYGMGLYGVGLYGTALQSSSSRQYPRIWFFDRYGDFMMMTPGNGGNLYEWDGNLTVAPVQTANSPAEINYFFVSDNIIVTFGNSGTENRITASDQNGRTVWSGTAQNQFYDDNIEGAGRLISHIQVQGLNLIFTNNKVYTFQYVGLPNVWKIEPLGNVGIISAFAGQQVNGVAYWQGLENFYMWAGGNVEVMPASTQPSSTILDYVFDNVNTSQKSKAFSWYFKPYQELRFHYPSMSSNEPDRVAAINILETSWWPDTIDRVAVERPTPALLNPRLSDVGGNLYQHEVGTDANGSPLSWTLATNLQTNSKKETLLQAFIPDSFQSGNINVQVDFYQWPQSNVPIQTYSCTVTPTQPRVEVGKNGRFRKYTFSGSSLGQYWQMGKWGEETQASGDGK